MNEAATRTERLLSMGFHVDEEDLHWLSAAIVVNQRYLHVRPPGDRWQALHRVLTKAQKGQVVDHINGNPKDNRKSNLRLTDYAGNAMNSAIRRNNKSGVRGVHYHQQDRRWVAQIRVNGKTEHIGRFANFEDAVAARRKRELELHGEFSPLHRPAAADPLR